MNPALKDAPGTVERKTYTVEEILGISRSSGFTAVRKGEIPSLRIGRRLVIPRAALEKMLNA